MSFPLTCGYCRNSPATRVIVVYLPKIGRHLELVCAECGEQGAKDAARIASAVYQYLLLSESSDQKPVAEPPILVPGPGGTHRTMVSGDVRALIGYIEQRDEGGRPVSEHICIPCRDGLHDLCEDDSCECCAGIGADE